MMDLPPPAVLLHVSRAALTNAERLLTDSHTLLELGSNPTAHALAILSLEETGKAMMCRFAAEGVEPYTSMNRATFRNKFSNHREKLRLVRPVLLYLASFAELVRPQSDLSSLLGIEDEIATEPWPVKLQRLVESDQARKLRGLYVDFGAKNDILLPNDMDEDDAALAYWIARFSLDTVLQMSGREGITAQPAEAGER